MRDDKFVMRKRVYVDKAWQKPCLRTNFVLDNKFVRSNTMRTLSLSLLVTIIMAIFLTGCSGSNNNQRSFRPVATIEPYENTNQETNNTNQNTSGQTNNAYENSRKATIESFIVYRQGREQLLNITSDSKYYEARIEALNLIDLRDVDEDLKAFYSVLNDEFREKHTLFKNLEEDVDQWGLVADGGGAIANELAGEDEVLQWLAGLVVGGVAYEAGAELGREYKKALDKIDEKYIPKEKELLQILSERYDYPFYDIVFGE